MIMKIQDSRLISTTAYRPGFHRGVPAFAGMTFQERGFRTDTIYARVRLFSLICNALIMHHESCTPKNIVEEKVREA